MRLPLARQYSEAAMPINAYNRAHAMPNTHPGGWYGDRSVGHGFRSLDHADAHQPMADGRAAQSASDGAIVI